MSSTLAQIYPMSMSCLLRSQASNFQVAGKVFKAEAHVGTELGARSPLCVNGTSFVLQSFPAK